MGISTSPPRFGTPSSLNPNRWWLFLHNLGRTETSGCANWRAHSGHSVR